MKTVDLTKDFDGPRDSCNYIESLSRSGTPYEYIDEDTMIVFEDQAEHEKWLEIASEPGGFFEKQMKRNELKEKIDLMSDEEICDLLEKINKRENEDEDNK